MKDADFRADQRYLPNERKAQKREKRAASKVPCLRKVIMDDIFLKSIGGF